LFADFRQVTQGPLPAQRLTHKQQVDHAVRQCLFFYLSKCPAVKSSAECRIWRRGYNVKRVWRCAAVQQPGQHD
jgi:hypothetical protein